MLEVWICIAVVLAAILLVLTFITKRKDDKKDVENVQQNRQVPVRAGRDLPPGARRRRRMAQGPARSNNDDDDNEDDEDDDDRGVGDVFDYVNAPLDGKIGAKKMRKLEEKAEKRRMREVELEEREERKKREEKAEAERRKKERVKEAEEAASAEEERLRKEEEERKEHEEYLKLKAAFAVEEEGEAFVASEEESQALLQRFIDYIQTQKVVLMEDLASHFSLRTQEAIQRVQDLQAMGRLTGVIDDRGKFIHVSMEEMLEVAKFIKLHGRISISDLAAASSTLINLTPQSDVLTLES